MKDNDIISNKPYRLGRKQKRAILDVNGLTVVVFEPHQYEIANKFVEFLNKQ